MLIDSEPRGLPGTSIVRIELQRAGDERPLDDVIVHTTSLGGDPAVLEIQVKRSIKFTPTDRIFREVVAQIVDASRRKNFFTSRYELAIAIARTSQKIDSAYQDVLTLARHIGDATIFVDRLHRPGAANDDMRTFVQTFRSHQREAGSADDAVMVWRLLQRLQILVFDFTAQASANEELVRERAVRALHPDERHRAGSLWPVLVEFALTVAVHGGDRTREALVEYLTSKAFRLAGLRRYASARSALAERATPICRKTHSS